MSVRHITDHDLLVSLDDELPESRRDALDRHLRECDTCFRRQAALEQTAIAASLAYRAVMDSGPAREKSRERLEKSLAEAAQARAPQPWTVGIAGLTTTSRRALAWSSAMAVVALVAWLSAPIGPRGAGTFRASDLGAPLPVASLTPGATWDISAEDLCAGTRHTRSISATMRAQVLSAYGMEHVPSDQYELDYLITPELGGATDARNLWPQAYASPVWNARVKDELENLLPRLVCGGRLDLETAQRDMAVDWIAAYKKYFNTDQPLQAHRGPARDDDDEVYTLADARPAPAVRLVSLAVLR
jgi:anti-sigma factor RsiW